MVGGRGQASGLQEKVALTKSAQLTLQVIKITKVRAWWCRGGGGGSGVRSPVFPLSAHQSFGGEECAQGLKKGPGARGARATDLSWANLEALLSSCHLQSQGIKGGGAGRGERWEGGSLGKDSKFRQWVGAAGYKGSCSRDTLTLL